LPCGSSAEIEGKGKVQIAVICGNLRKVLVVNVV
jgi:hypothetical protein